MIEKPVEKDVESTKQFQDLMSYLRGRVMPILQPLQFDILAQKPIDVHQFSYFWLQNFKQQQSKINMASSSDEQPDQQNLKKLQMLKQTKKQRPRQGISGQIYSTIKTQELIKNNNIKNEEDKIKILVKLRNHIFFKFLSENNIQEIIKCMKSLVFNPGDIVVREGDCGDELFIVDSGVFKCVIQSQREEPRLYGPGEAFGELALLYNSKRASTISAVSEGKLFSLDRNSYNRILRYEVEKKTKICEETLQKNIIFSTLTEYEKYKLIQNIKQISLPSGKYIIKEGQIGDCFYIVNEGTNIKQIGKLVAEKMQDNGQIKSVYYFKQGDYFGEIALIRNVLRQASVKTLTSSKLFYIQRATFKRLLGPLQKLLKRNEDRYKSIKQTVKQTMI